MTRWLAHDQLGTPRHRRSSRPSCRWRGRPVGGRRSQLVTLTVSQREGHNSASEVTGVAGPR